MKALLLFLLSSLAAPVAAVTGTWINTCHGSSGLLGFTHHLNLPEPNCSVTLDPDGDVIDSSDPAPPGMPGEPSQTDCNDTSGASFTAAGADSGGVEDDAVGTLAAVPEFHPGILVLGTISLILLRRRKR